MGQYRLGIVKFSDWGTQGYIITRRAAQRYFEYYPKIVYRSIIRCTPTGKMDWRHSLLIHPSCITKIRPVRTHFSMKSR